MDKLLIWCFSWGVGSNLITNDRNTKFEFIIRDLFSSDI